MAATGRTGHPDLGDLAAFDPDNQMLAIYNFFDVLVGERRATAADLPATGNWSGRTIMVEDEPAPYQWTSGGWKRIVDMLDTGWVQPPLNSGWTNLASSELKYRRRNGVVYLRGRATTTGATANAFTLPAGFRPGDRVIMFVETNGVTPQPIASRCTVHTDGSVGQLAAAAATNLSFGNFPPFPADA